MHSGNLLTVAKCPHMSFQLFIATVMHFWS